MQGRLRPGQLLRFFQEASATHAATLGVSTTDLAEQHLAWMLYRIRFEVVRWPKSGETVTLITYPSGFLRTLATREFELRDQQNDSLIQASSAWLVANTETRRVISIPEWIAKAAASDASPLLDISSRRVAKLDVSDFAAQELTVTKSDIDFLHHVNNVRYVEWILETIPKQTNQTAELSSLDIQFRKESVLGDKLSVLTKTQANGYAHRILKASSQEELIQAVTTWA